VNLASGVLSKLNALQFWPAKRKSISKDKYGFGTGKPGQQRQATIMETVRKQKKPGSD